MAQRRNVFTQMGRPPKPKVTPTTLPNGEKQGLSPTSNLDTRIPAKAFATGGSVKSMPRYHDDPAWGRKGKC